jgi:hypothetical protein
MLVRGKRKGSGEPRHRNMNGIKKMIDKKKYCLYHFLKRFELVFENI